MEPKKLSIKCHKIQKNTKKLRDNLNIQPKNDYKRVRAASLSKFDKTLNNSINPPKSVINPKHPLKPITLTNETTIYKSLASPFKISTYSYTLPFIKNSKIYTSTKLDLFKLEIEERNEGMIAHKYFRPTGIDFFKKRISKCCKKINGNL